MKEALKPAVGDDDKRWFAMRDLTRSNAKLPAYKMLAEKNIKCFTPMVTKFLVRNGTRKRVVVPFIHDLIFVYDTRSTLDPIVAKVQTFQYRYLRHTNRQPMTINKEEMDRFIAAVEAGHSPQYYSLDEISPEMRNRKIRIIGGVLDGYEGSLITVRGSKVKRLLVELPSLLAASVEVEPEYIQLL